MRLSVIIPTLDEEGRIEAVLRGARASAAIELIVVDGGSSDRTAAVAAAIADRVLSAPRGRASQMNAGARAASGEVLLFLHADTRLPPDFAAAIEAALSASDVVGGRFDVRLEPTTPLLGLVAFLMNRRSRLTGIATGDQAIFVRRAVFERLGGYGDMPLMEDIDLTRRLKRLGRVAALRARVTTSSRRWLEAGPLRTILLMWALRLLYFAGVSPARLRRFYADRR